MTNDPLLQRLRELPRPAIDERFAAKVQLRARSIVTAGPQKNENQGAMAWMDRVWSRMIAPALVVGSVAACLVYAIAAVNGIAH